MSLLFNTLSMFVIVFRPRSKCLLISLPQSPSAVILESKKIKSVPISIVSPSICHEVIGLDAMIFVFLMLSLMPAFPFPSELSDFLLSEPQGKPHLPSVSLKTDLGRIKSFWRVHYQLLFGSFWWLMYLLFTIKTRVSRDTWILEPQVHVLKSHPCPFIKLT